MYSSAFLKAPTCDFCAKSCMVEEGEAVRDLWAGDHADVFFPTSLYYDMTNPNMY